LTPLKEVTGTAMQAINAGMALGADGACVAMRIDFEVYETPPAVTQEFFEQGPQDVLFGQEWAILLDKELLISTARQKVQEGLEGKSKVKLLWGPEVQWEPATPKLVVNSGVKILDACPFFVSNIDLKVELQAEMTFAVAAPNELHLKFHLDAWASDIGQIIGCAVVPSLFWPIAGPIVLNELKSNSVVGDYFAGLLLGLPMICSQIASAIALLGVKEVSAESFGPHCVKTTDSDVDCTYPLSFNAGAVFPISMRDASVHGTVAGLVLCGPSQLRDLQEEIITVTTSPLEWTLTGGCRSGFGIVDQAQISVASTGRRGGLCSARSLDDPLNEFTVTVDRAENMVTVRAKASPAYAALDPKYQCKVRVVTTGGVRTITYPAPEPITAERKRELERFEHNFNQVCQAWKDTFVKIEWGGWGPPMPVDGPDWLQYWEVAIHDLRGDEQVDVVTEAGVAVLEARASVNGVAHLGAIFRGRTGPAAILIGRRGGGPYQKAPTITAVQMILEHRMSIPTEGLSVVMRFRGPDADRQLLIVDAVKERIFALGSRTAGPIVRSVARSISTESNRKEYPEERVKETFSLVTLEALNQIEMREGPAITIADPRVGGVARPLFVRTKVRGALYDIVEGQEPRVAQIYAGNAWFEQIALGGSWVARLNNEGSAVDLYFAISRRLDVDISRSTTA
jgi:hypothetical protein